jgi:hypothetical protein
VKPSAAAVVASICVAFGVLASLFALGCGSRCAEVAAARDALAQRRGAADRGSDVRVVVPLARADALLADVLREQPVTVPLSAPELSLGPVRLAMPVELAAVARQVRLRPGPPEKLRFAIELDVVGGGEKLTSLAMVVEVTPELQREDGAAELSIRFGLENVLEVEPVLDPDSPAALVRAVLRWAPAALRDRLPRSVVESTARQLGAHLAGAAYQQLRRTLLPRLGEVTRLRLRLPDVPIATLKVRSHDGAAHPRMGQPGQDAPGLSSGGALIVEILTDLPVRRGLIALAPAAVGDVIAVQLAPSATAELSNWAIDHGHLPPWYTRGLTPSEGGEFRPRFDFVPEDAAHPFKIYAFQERGGCSYFRVGVQARVAIVEPGGGPAQLVVTALDRALEAASANPVIEAAAWVKYFLFGSVDLSKRLAARTQLSVGDRRFESRVTSARLDEQELRFTLELAVAPAPASAAVAATSRTSRRR